MSFMTSYEYIHKVYSAKHFQGESNLSISGTKMMSDHKQQGNANKPKINSFLLLVRIFVDQKLLKFCFENYYNRFSV